VTTGLAFLLLVGHLGIMLPFEAVRILSVGDDRGDENHKHGRVFRKSRKLKWPLPWVYTSVAAQIGVASFALGMINAGNMRILACALACTLLVWRFALVKAAATEGRPHTPALKAPSRTGLVLNFIADVPVLLVLLVMWLLSGQTIWLVGFFLFFAYSFLVRTGQYEHEHGPYMYLATLLSLLLSAATVWPIASYLDPSWTSFPSWLPPVALGGYTVLQEGFSVAIPLRKRLIPATFVLFILAFELWTALLGGEVQFAPLALLGHSTLGTASQWLTGFGAFGMVLLFHLLLVDIGKARKWLLRARDASNRNPPFDRPKSIRPKTREAGERSTPGRDSGGVGD
jgi:hypothetical protein